MVITRRQSRICEPEIVCPPVTTRPRARRRCYTVSPTRTICSILHFCNCFYVCYILTCILLSMVIYSVLTSYSKTLSQIEDLKSEINMLRNEVLTDKEFKDKPTPAIDSTKDSKNVNDKVLDMLISLQNKPDSCESQFDMLLKRLDSIQQQLSRQPSKSTGMTSVSKQKLSETILPTDRVDYAAESLGGEILSTDDTQLLKMYYFGSIFGWIENTPRMIIQPAIFPGECYGFAGTNGSVVIKLMARVFVDAVTVGHIPKELSPSGELNTAPREITVSGLTTPEDEQPTELATIEYDINKDQVFQTFPVATGIVSFQFIRFNFTSNYGNPNHTCVYRVRVHGKLDEK